MNEPLGRFLLSLADDELVLGHRDAEWTGHGPILEEDIAFSNIAQDELGHALLWYTLYCRDAGRSPDALAFERAAEEFTCCRFVAYPKGDFAYTVVRQYLFDEAEQVRLTALVRSTAAPLREAAGKILREEAYHLLHVGGLLARLAVGTEESHRRMQAALDVAFPQALGIFEPLEGEEMLIREGVFPGNTLLKDLWIAKVSGPLTAATLTAPADAPPDNGGRHGSHTPHLLQLVEDLQQVYRTVPGGPW